MRKKALWLFYFCLFSISGFGQTLRIVNEKSGEPISDVFIFHDKRSFTAFTDKKGEADISNFPKSGYFHFQHPSYSDLDFPADSLQILNYQLTLTERTVWFNELVVAANKWEQEEKDLSQTVMSIGRKEIAFTNPATSADLLAQSGQVFVQKSQLGGGSPKLRGFSANAVLMVVDGVRMNNAIYRSGNLQNIISIDPNALASAEVVFGPGSVIYGSDALGGVMDFHTITPRWSPNEIKTSVTTFTRYASAANERTAHVDASVVGKKMLYFGSVTKTWMDDLRAGANRNKHYKGYFLRPNYVTHANGIDILKENTNPNVQVGSGFDLLNTIQKVKIMMGEQTDITYGFYYSTTTNIPRYDRLVITQSATNNELLHGDWYYGPQVWKMHSLKLNNYTKTRPYDQMSLTLALQEYEESRNDRDFGNDRLRTRTEHVFVNSMNLDMEKELMKGTLFYGFEITHNEVTSEGFRRSLSTGVITPTSSRYPDGGSTMTTAAAYLNRILKLQEKWTLNVGARYSFVGLKADQKTDNTSLVTFDKINLKNGAVNGMIGLIHLPNEASKISLTLSSGFRSPNVDDVGKIFEFDQDQNGQPLLLVPNEQLKPEYSYNSELSYARKLGKFTLSAVGFYTIMTSPIIRGNFEINGQPNLDIDHDNDPATADVTHRLIAQVNGDQAYIYGSSLQVRIDLTTQWQLYSSTSFSDGKESSNKEPLRHTTPAFGKFGATFTTKNSRYDLYSEYSGHRWRKDMPASEIVDKPDLYTANGSPGWATLNFKSSHELNKFLTLGSGIENIFDTHYRTYSSGISAPGRNFIVSLRGTF